MARNQILRAATRAAAQSKPPASPTRNTFLQPARSVSTTIRRNKEEDKYHKSSTAATGTSAGAHEGSASRTDNQISFEYPSENEHPKQQPFRRTLPTFSLEGRVGIVTGGARGLGLVMGQAIVASGADLAIVDLNSMYTEAHLRLLLIAFQRKKASGRQRTWWRPTRRRTQVLAHPKSRHIMQMSQTPSPSTPVSLRSWNPMERLTILSPLLDSPRTSMLLHTRTRGSKSYGE